MSAARVSFLSFRLVGFPARRRSYLAESERPLRRRSQSLSPLGSSSTCERPCMRMIDRPRASWKRWTLNASPTNSSRIRQRVYVDGNERWMLKSVSCAKRKLYWPGPAMATCYSLGTAPWAPCYSATMQASPSAGFKTNRTVGDVISLSRRKDGEFSIHGDEWKIRHLNKDASHPMNCLPNRGKRPHLYRIPPD